MPTIAWALLIFILSSKTFPPTSEFYWKDFAVKKSAHIFVYGILAILFYRSLLGEKVNKTKAMYWAFLLALVYGVTDEIHQSFTPGREPRVRDLFFDGVGAIIGVYFARMKIQ